MLYALCAMRYTLHPTFPSIHNFTTWVPFLPILPAGVVRRQFRQPSFEINSLDAHQTLWVGVPQRVGLSIIENKSSLIGPPGRNQSQGFPVNFAAVHSRQVHQWSVGGRNLFIPDAAVGNLMPIQPWNRIGMGFLSIGYPDDPQ